MNKMTVAKALKEIKTLDDKINRAHSEGTYIGMFRGGKDVHHKFANEQDMVKAIQSSFDKIDQLRDYRSKVKAAVVQSNAQTMVELPIIGKISIAQAIEYKSVIAERKKFVDTVKMQMVQIDQYAQRCDQENKQTIEQRINAVSSGENAPDELVIKSIRESVDSQLGYKVVDTKKVREFIQKELDCIAEFEDNVDDIINTSNVITVIEV